MFQIRSLKRTKITSRLVEISPCCKVDIVNSNAFIEEVTQWVYGIVDALNDYFSWELEIKGKQDVTIETTIELWKTRNRLKEEKAGTYIFTATLHNLIEYLKGKGIEITEREVALRLKKVFEEKDKRKAGNQN
jgi:hypothetical protein